MQQAAGLVLADSDWHRGVIGIVAGRIAERYGRPTVMIAMDDDQNRWGRVRDAVVRGFDLHAAIVACGEHLETFGGHKAAVGLRVRKELVETFRESFAEYVAAHRQKTERRRDDRC